MKDPPLSTVSVAAPESPSVAPAPIWNRAPPPVTVIAALVPDPLAASSEPLESSSPPSERVTKPAPPWPIATSPVTLTRLPTPSTVNVPWPGCRPPGPKTPSPTPSASGTWATTVKPPLTVTVESLVTLTVAEAAEPISSCRLSQLPPVSVTALSSVWLLPMMPSVSVRLPPPAMSRLPDSGPPNGSS